MVTPPVIPSGRQARSATRVRGGRGRRHIGMVLRRSSARPRAPYNASVLQPLSPSDLAKAASEGVDQAALARARIVHFQKVRPGRDYGTTLEILDGLHDGEDVVVNPGDAVKEGAIVQMADSEANSKPAPGPTK